MWHSSGPYLCLYQILSTYFKPLRSYGVHKNLERNLFSGITRKSRARVVLLACNTPTWTDICLNQILSNYRKQYGSYGLHKISASGEITYWRKWELSLLPVTHLLVLLFIPTKYESNPLKNKGNISKRLTWEEPHRSTPTRLPTRVLAILKDGFLKPIQHQQLENMFTQHYASNYMLSLKHALTVILKGPIC